MYNFEKQSTSMLFRNERCLVLIHPLEKVEFEVFNLFGLFFFQQKSKNSVLYYKSDDSGELKFTLYFIRMGLFVSSKCAYVS